MTRRDEFALLALVWSLFGLSLAGNRRRGARVTKRTLLGLDRKRRRT